MAASGYYQHPYFSARYFTPVWFAPADEEEEQPDIGGGGIYRPDWPFWKRAPQTVRRTPTKRGELGVTKEMLKPISDQILAVLEREDVPEPVKVKVKKAVKSVAKMQRSDELTTVAAEDARVAVEQAWMDLQAEKLQMETRYSIVGIEWLLTLQQDLSMLYGMIDDEEAAIVLLMSI